MEQQRVGELGTLRLARQRIPFLQEIPESLYWKLDPRDWVIPDDEVLVLCRRLEEFSGHYVMTYEYVSSHWDRAVDQHLCAIIATAVLKGEQRQELDRIEGLLVPRNISLEVYKRPLRLIDPNTSLLAKYLEVIERDK